MSAQLAYRADIDGLRAVAVLSVLGFHFFPQFFPGGFIGVDVFFVISGYLITKILLTEAAAGGISYTGFYARRVLRIFPALTLVLISCFVFGWHTLLASEFKQLGKHMLAGAGFVSNFALWFEAGYFDNVSETKPLLHLWSLGIEEQFYIFWPLLLPLLLKQRPWALRCLLGLAALSLMFATAVVWFDRTQAFYSPLSRAWELLAGALLAYLQWSAHPWLERLRMRGLSWVALVLIGGGVFLIHASNPFPGALALVPVLGAFVLIGAGPATWLHARLLSHPLLVRIGLISYPLYLWHWPLLSFATIMNSGTPSVGTRLLLLVVSFGLASATYHALEKPVRRGPRKIVLGLLAALMVLIALAGKNVWDRDGLERIRHKKLITLNEQANQDFVEWEKTGLIPKISCKTPFQFPEHEDCLTTHPEREPTVALIGDSHAFHAYWGLSQALDARGQNLVLLGRGACVPFWDFKRGRDESKCQPHINQTITYVANSPHIQKVILVLRGRYLGNDASPEDVAAFRSGLEQTLERFLAAHKQVIYFLPVAEPGFDPRLCVGALPLGRKPPQACVISRATDEDKTRLLRQTAQQVLAQHPSVKVFDPNDALCTTGACSIVMDGHSMWKDDNHLSYAGSLRVGRNMGSALAD